MENDQPIAKRYEKDLKMSETMEQGALPGRDWSENDSAIASMYKKRLYSGRIAWKFYENGSNSFNAGER